MHNFYFVLFMCTFVVNSEDLFVIGGKISSGANSDFPADFAGQFEGRNEGNPQKHAWPKVLTRFQKIIPISSVDDLKIIEEGT